MHKNSKIGSDILVSSQASERSLVSQNLFFRGSLSFSKMSRIALADSLIGSEFRTVSTISSLLILQRNTRDDLLGLCEEENDTFSPQWLIRRTFSSLLVKTVWSTVPSNWLHRSRMSLSGYPIPFLKSVSIFYNKVDEVKENCNLFARCALMQG